MSPYSLCLCHIYPLCLCHLYSLCYTLIHTLTHTHIYTHSFLKVAVSDFLTLFSARTGEKWFWQSRPATPLLVASVGALLYVHLLLSMYIHISLSIIYTYKLPPSIYTYIY